jgi:hypothetical protein
VLAHRDRVKEPGLAEPVVLDDYAIAEQRHDREPGTEDQGRWT